MSAVTSIDLGKKIWWKVIVIIFWERKCREEVRCVDEEWYFVFKWCKWCDVSHPARVRAGEPCYNVTTSHHHQHHQYTSPGLVPSFLLYLLYIYVYFMELKIEQLLTSRMSIRSNQLLEQGKLKSWIIKFFFKWFYFTTSLLNSEIFKSYWAQTTTALAQQRAY